MGTSHSHPQLDAKTQWRGNLGNNNGGVSPKQRSNKSHTSDTSSRSQSWMNEGIDVQDAYDIHAVIAYGHLGPVRICSRRRPPHSTHTGEVLVVQNHHVTTSERTMTSSESSNATNNKGSYHRLFACKTISTSRLLPEVQDELLQDMSRIRDLPSHSNIVSFYRVYRMKRQIHVITELCTGGDLHSRMNFLTEIDIVDILEQVTSAIAFLHNHGMHHSNLKLENVLYEHMGSNAGIKLVDFGVSLRYGKCRDCRRVCGAEYASAPEVYFDAKTDSPSISSASDVWSIGVLAYYMLSGGTYPFGTDRVVEEDRLQTASFSFHDEWDQRGISETARTFCSHCFELDPNQRWTANDALVFIQEWMTSAETLAREQPTEALPPSPTLDVSLRGTQGFGLFGQRRKRLLIFLANTMTCTDLKRLGELFMDLDSTKSGLLTMNQVKHAVKQYSKENESCTLTKDDFKLMFKGYHQDRSFSIEYLPFLNAVVKMQGMMAHERLGDALDRADPEDKGLLSQEELKSILCQHGCDEQVIDRLILESNCEKHGGMVKYEVFLETLFRDPGEAMKHINPMPKDSMHLV